MPATTLMSKDLFMRLPDQIPFMDWLSAFISREDPGYPAACEKLGLSPLESSKWSDYKRFSACNVQGQGLKLQIQAGHFVSNNLNEDFAYCKSLIDTFPGCMKIHVSRVDLSLNFKTIDLQKLHFRTHPGTYFARFMKDGIDLGFLLGRRGKANCQLRVYQKFVDPNRYHDFIRWGTTDFTRCEWELGKDKLLCTDLLSMSVKDLIESYRRVLPSRWPHFKEQAVYLDPEGCRPPLAHENRDERGIWQYDVETSIAIIGNHISKRSKKEWNALRDWFLWWFGNDCPELSDEDITLVRYLKGDYIPASELDDAKRKSEYFRRHVNATEKQRKF